MKSKGGDAYRKERERIFRATEERHNDQWMRAVAEMAPIIGYGAAIKHMNEVRLTGAWRNLR